MFPGNFTIGTWSYEAKEIAQLLTALAVFTGDYRLEIVIDNLSCEADGVWRQTSEQVCDSVSRKV